MDVLPETTNLRSTESDKKVIHKPNPIFHNDDNRKTAKSQKNTIMNTEEERAKQDEKFTLKNPEENRHKYQPKSWENKAFTGTVEVESVIAPRDKYEGGL